MLFKKINEIHEKLKKFINSKEFVFASCLVLDAYYFEQIFFW